MRGLTIILSEPAELRLRSALGLALSHAALGGQARLFVDTAAVPILRRPIVGAADQAHAAIGFPDLAGLVAEALEAGVMVQLCQAGLALAHATPADFDPRIEASGMISLLQTLGDDRLVMA